jgi:hypothetical protein
VTDTRGKIEHDPNAPSGRFTRAEESAPGHPASQAGKVPRTRHDVPLPLRPLLRPFFRYSYSRDAWVLVAIGDRRGPVFRNL